MFPGDSWEWAKTRASEFNDKRLIHYWDGERLTGKEWQKVLGTKSLAWDVYLLYEAASQWDNKTAAPDFWMHQLSGVTNAPRLDQAILEAKAKEMVGKVRR